MSKCEVCGKPSTCEVLDVRKIEPMPGHVLIEPVGPAHHFCDEHKRPRAVADARVPPMTKPAIAKELVKTEPKPVSKKPEVEKKV